MIQVGKENAADKIKYLLYLLLARELKKEGEKTNKERHEISPHSVPIYSSHRQE